MVVEEERVPTRSFFKGAPNPQKAPRDFEERDGDFMKAWIAEFGPKNFRVLDEKLGLADTANHNWREMDHFKQAKFQNFKKEEEKREKARRESASEEED